LGVFRREGVSGPSKIRLGALECSGSGEGRRISLEPISQDTLGTDR
jgi:hypothetical protein